VAIGAIAGLAYADSWLAYLHPSIEAVLEGKPTIIVRDGRFERVGMRSERMNEKDVMAHLRTEGIHDIREVHLAVVELDGTVSVLKHEWADPAQRADVDKDEARARDKAIDDRETPSPSQRTDSRSALNAA
jgi:uncharacterized membrane protein YcaP (DUF421 family)